MIIFDNLLMLVEMGGFVMIPICLVSVWLWALVFVKGCWLYKVAKKEFTIAQAVELLNAKTATEDIPEAGLRSFVLRDYIAESLKSPVKRIDAELCFLDVAVRRQIREVERYTRAILVLAAVSPLLGLFGTVSGMIETFQVIGMYGMGNAQAMASGIREAMITTQAGLLVAIPGIFIGQMLKRKTQKFGKELHVFQCGVASWIEKEYSK